MSVVFADIETYSERNLKDHGAYILAADPSTDVNCLCFAIDDGEVQVWKPGDPVPTPFADPAGHTFIFDTWSFEREILAHVLVPRYGFKPIPIDSMDCAQRRALASAFPAELGLRCKALGLPYQKDKAAHAAMLRLSRPQKRKRKRKQKQSGLLEEILEAAARERDRELTIQRCKLDVEMTRATYNHPRIRPLPTEERCVLLADAGINAGGVHANVPFLEAAQAFATKERDAINAQISELTSGTITSVDQVPRIQKAVNAHGHNMTTLGKHSVSAVLAHKPDNFTREILTLRQRGSAIKPKKFQPY